MNTMIRGLLSLGCIFTFLAFTDSGCGGNTTSDPDTSGDVTLGGAGGALGTAGSSGRQGGSAGQGGLGAGHAAGGVGQVGGSSGRGGGGPMGGGSGKAGGSAAHGDGGAGQPGGDKPKDGGPGSHTGGAADGATGAATGGQHPDGSADSAPMGTGGTSDSGADAPVFDASLDVTYDVSTLPQFMELLTGTWLIGWTGGLNHYSWVRIERGSSNWTGVARFSSGQGLQANGPYWPCNGAGTWDIPEKPNSLIFTFPASCTGAPAREFTFENFSAPRQYPRGAILQASVVPLSGSTQVDGFKFPDTQCDAEMSSCTDPL